MSRLSYCGRPAPEWCGYEVFEPAAHALEARSLSVPGLAGAKLLGCEVPPRTITVRIWPDLGPDAGEEEAEAAKRRLRLWLLAAGGGTLRLPSGIEYRDAVVTGSAAWPSDKGGYADIEFTCFDPIGYGAEVVSEAERFDLGGTWPSRPVVRGRSDGTGYAGATYACGEGPFTAGLHFPAVEGDEVVLDFEKRAILINQQDRSADADLESEWFALAPGSPRVIVSGLKGWTVTCRERWV